MLYEQALKQKKWKLQCDDMEQAMRQILRHEEGLFASWWQQLAKKKHAQAILLALASEQSPYSVPDVSRANLNRVVMDLKAMGYIERRDVPGRQAHYFICDRFFAKYVAALTVASA